MDTHFPSTSSYFSPGFGLAVLASDTCKCVFEATKAVHGLGWELRCVGNVNETLSYVADQSTRLVLIDLDSEAFDPFDLLALVRSHEKSKANGSLPVVAYVSEVSDQMQARCALEGFQLVANKSASPEELRDRVSHMLLRRIDSKSQARKSDRDGLMRFISTLALDLSTPQLRSFLAGIRLAFQGEILRLTRDAALSIARLPQDADERERIVAVVLQMSQHSKAIGCVHWVSLARRLAHAASEGVEGQDLMLGLMELREELACILLAFDDVGASDSRYEVG